MKFTFTEKRMEAGGDLRAYAEKKVGKIDRLFKNDSEAFITFSMERGRFTIELTLSNNGMFYRVRETTSDAFASVDSACAAIERQIRKNKTRLEKKLREGAFEREIKPMYVEPEEDEFAVIRTKKFPIKPMTVEEAILQMNLLEHEFFVFKNHEDEDAFSVVYRRKDGGYGLIASSDA